MASRKRLGVLAGDLGGFPNGRRVSDDVLDIAARAVAGALCGVTAPCTTGQFAAPFLGTSVPAIGDGIRSASGPLPVNLMLLTGPSINMTKLDAAAQATMPGVDSPTITTRSRALQELTGSPLQQGTFLLFTLAIAYAAALARSGGVRKKLCPSSSSRAHAE